MTRLDDLANQAEEARTNRERRTAVAHAFADLARGGSGTPSRAVVDALIRSRDQRLDGTQMTTRDTTPVSRPTATNHANDITSNYAPLSGRED
jgi:hypothetical protein